MKTTITNHTEYHHMPDHAERVDLIGLTVRKAMAALRAEAWGNMGGTHTLDVSDGSEIEVCLAPAKDGGQPMSSQQIIRTTWSRSQYWTRKYKI